MRSQSWLDWLSKCFPLSFRRRRLWIDMECLACGSDNQEDSQFCRRCGTRFSATQVTSSTPQEMDTKVQEAPSPATIPEDAIIALQSWWAYMLPSTVPLLILSGLVFFDILTFGILPIVIGFSVIGYRYLVFRRTAYILTEKHLVILQGSLMAQNRIDVPFADLNNILVQPGMFGRFLGYTGVRLQLVDQRVALLHYVPIASPLLEHLRARMNPDSPHEEEPGEKL